MKACKKRISIGSFFCILLLIASIETFSQRGYDWRTNIDMIVQETDSLSLLSQRTFFLNKVIRNDRSFRNDEVVKETWHYTLRDGKVIIFQIRYVIDSSEFTETYYLDRGRLICMENYESEYFTYDDNIIWGEVNFFVNNTLKLHVSVGRKKPTYREWYPGASSLEAFSRRYSELQRNLRKPLTE